MTQNRLTYWPALYCDPSEQRLEILEQLDGVVSIGFRIGSQLKVIIEVLHNPRAVRPRQETHTDAESADNQRDNHNAEDDMSAFFHLPVTSS